MTTKPTHGGTRQGSGRPNKYGEATVKLQFRIPVSKVETLKTMFKNLQNQWKNDFTNQRSSSEL